MTSAFPTRRRRRTCFALAGAALAAAILLPALRTRAADWPQFRGSHGDGISRETGLLTDWPAAGPRELWRRPLGEGYSGLSVVAGKLYTLYADGSSELVVALDADTGEEIWRHRLDAKYFDGQGNGPRSTPLVSGGIVYAVGARGKLAALDADTGEPVWTQDLKKSFGARAPQWGISASPWIEGDLLLLDVGGRDGASVAALDKRSGIKRWTSASDKPGYSTPLVADLAGKRQAVFFTGSQVISVDLADGQPLWNLRWKTSYDVNAATPVHVPPDRVFISSGYGVGAALLEVERQGDRFTVDEVWRSRRMKNQFSSSVFYRGNLYGFDDSILKSLDAETGEENWKARGLEGTNQGFGHGTVLIADDHLWLLGVRCGMALARATPERYQELASFQPFSGKCWTVPTIADGTLFLRNEEVVVAYDVSGGRADDDDGETTNAR